MALKSTTLTATTLRVLYIWSDVSTLNCHVLTTHFSNKGDHKTLLYLFSIIFLCLPKPLTHNILPCTGYITIPYYTSECTVCTIWIFLYVLRCKSIHTPPLHKEKLMSGKKALHLFQVDCFRIAKSPFSEERSYLSVSAQLARSAQRWASAPAPGAAQRLQTEGRDAAALTSAADAGSRPTRPGGFRPRTFGRGFSGNKPSCWSLALRDWVLIYPWTLEIRRTEGEREHPQLWLLTKRWILSTAPPTVNSDDFLSG